MNMLGLPKPSFRNMRKREQYRASREWTRLKKKILGADAHRCQNQECRKALIADVHHIIKRSLGGPDEPWNLISFCRECHRRADNDPVFVMQILGSKQKQLNFRHDRAIREMNMRNWRLQTEQVSQ